MDIRHQRHVHFFPKGPQGFGGLPIGHRHPDNVGARFVEGIDLGCRIFCIHRAEGAHGLNGNGRAAAYGNGAYMDLSGFFHFIT